MSRQIDTDAVIASIRMQEQGAAPATPASGFAMIYIDTAGNAFIRKDSGAILGPLSTGTVSVLGGLTDVDPTAPSSDQVLSWDGVSWSPADVADLLPDPVVEELNDIGDVTIGVPADRDILSYDDGQGEWRNTGSVKHIGSNADLFYLTKGFASRDFTLVPTGSYTALDSDILLLFDSTNGNVILDLPAVPNEGQVVIIKDIGGNAATNEIDLSNNTIDGGNLTEVQTDYGAVMLQYINSAWYCILANFDYTFFS